MTPENLDSLLFQYQDRIINNPPKDYHGDEFDWQLNTIYWIATIRDKILNDTISITLVDFIATSLEKQSQIKR